MNDVHAKGFGLSSAPFVAIKEVNEKPKGKFTEAKEKERKKVVSSVKGKEECLLEIPDYSEVAENPKETVKSPTKIVDVPQKEEK